MPLILNLKSSNEGIRELVNRMIPYWLCHKETVNVLTFTITTYSQYSRLIVYTPRHSIIYILLHSGVRIVVAITDLVRWQPHFLV